MRYTPSESANAPCCPVCATRHVYAPMSRWGALWRCECGYEQPDTTTQQADAYERAMLAEWQREERVREESDWLREVIMSDMTRTGRCVPETATGGDATGESKPPVNPHKWMRRGA